MAEETFICSHCGQMFHGTSALMVHQRTHLADQMCNSHTGEAPHRCASDCGKCSRQNAPLPLHQGACLMEKPFSSPRTTAEVSWQPIRQEEGKMAGARGLSWRRDETLDLLSIWGDKSIQTALRESHRNKDIFDDVAKQMAERGHRRSAEECRTKTKGLRLAYKRVLSDNKSGNSLVTCPYYEILDRILKGDPSVKTKRVSQSLRREAAPRTEAPPPQEQHQHTIDLLPAIQEERGKVKEEAPSTSGTRDVPSHGDRWRQAETGGGVPQVETDGDRRRQVEESLSEDPDESQIDEVVLEGEEEGSQQKEEIPEGMDRRNLNAIPPGVALEDLPPSSRLALQRAKRKRVSAIQRVGEMMLQQSSREHRAMLEAGRKENELFLEEMRAARHQEKEGTDTMCSLFRDALTTLKEMSRAMMQSRSGVTQERGQGPEQEYGFDTQPSTSGMGQPTWGEVEAQPSASGVGQPAQEDALVHSPVEVTPSPQATSSPTGRPSGSLVMRRASRYQPRALGGYRTKRLVRGKKPYLPSN